LALAPRLDQEEGSIDFSPLKAIVKEDAVKSSGLDVLFIMDCCCAAIDRRGGTLGGRVEFMAASTAPSGISNARVDGITFTQDLCEAFSSRTGVYILRSDERNQCGTKGGTVWKGLCPPRGMGLHVTHKHGTNIRSP
jgi:hypothetical protein